MKTDPRARGTREPAQLRVVVAPDAGRLRLLPPRAFRDGREWVERGQPIARVERGAVVTFVQSPVDGSVAAVLGLEGEPVVAGQPVVAIEPREPQP